VNTVPRLKRQVAEHPYPLLFATISGAHLYGFPSPDSDYDLRGVHLLPLEQVVGLKAGQETVEKSGIHDGLEIDLVTHDAKKFFGLMLKKNGYVLEQLLSPLIVYTTPEHEELKARPRLHHAVSCASLSWLRPDAMEALSKVRPAARQAALVRLPRLADRHPPDAHRRSGGELIAAERDSPTAVLAGVDRTQNRGRGKRDSGAKRSRLPPSRV
jgi:hypothetical protein